MNEYYNGFKELRTILTTKSKPAIKLKPNSKTKAILKAFETYRHESTLVRNVDKIRAWINRFIAVKDRR